MTIMCWGSLIFFTSCSLILRSDGYSLEEPGEDDTAMDIWYGDRDDFPGYDTDPEFQDYIIPEYQEYSNADFGLVPSHEEHVEEEAELENVTTVAPEKFVIIWQWDDASWIMCACFMVFTMQTGFAMLESGAASLKNEVNIMMKNVIDCLMGGLSYWAIGYGLSYGEGPLTNPFIAFGDFFVSADGMQMGPTYATFFFQLAYASTGTTIVSGAISERTNFYFYIVFSFLNTFVYCIPAGWLWGDQGFLRNLHVVDLAGSCGVHLVGGTGALVAAWMLGPRLGRWDIEGDPPMGSATNAMIGVSMLWWAWIAFNQGATFGISGKKWIITIKATITSILASFAGGSVGFAFSMATRKGKTEVMLVCNGILAALVSIMAGCANVTNIESIVIGGVGALLSTLCGLVLPWLKIDDPVSASCVHGVGGLWGMLAVGLFGKKDNLEGYTKYDGLFHGGGLYLLGVQGLACVCCIAWAGLSTLFFISCLRCCIRFR